MYSELEKSIIERYGENHMVPELLQDFLLILVREKDTAARKRFLKFSHHLHYAMLVGGVSEECYRLLRKVLDSIEWGDVMTDDERAAWDDCGETEYRKFVAELNSWRDYCAEKVSQDATYQEVLDKYGDIYSSIHSAFENRTLTRLQVEKLFDVYNKLPHPSSYKVGLR